MDRPLKIGVFWCEQTHKLVAAGSSPNRPTGFPRGIVHYRDLGLEYRVTCPRYCYEDVTRVSRVFLPGQNGFSHGVHGEGGSSHLGEA
jgi:hypothetical protein